MVSLSEQQIVLIMSTVSLSERSDNEYVPITNCEEGVSIMELVPITRSQCSDDVAKFELFTFILLES